MRVRACLSVAMQFRWNIRYSEIYVWNVIHVALLRIDSETKEKGFQHLLLQFFESNTSQEAGKTSPPYFYQQYR
jgi:hypothetical protein